MINKAKGAVYEQFMNELKQTGEAGAFFTDTHSHIHMDEFLCCVDDVVKRAADNYVRRIITVGTELDDSRMAMNVAEPRDNVYFAVGVHPHESESFTEDSIAEFKTMLAHKKCLAVGEIGLDYYYDLSPKDTQKKIFRRFLELAVEHNKPVIIHNRDSADDCVEIMNDVIKGRDKSGIIHCFSGDMNLLRWALDNGFYISYAGPVTYSKSDDLRETIKYVPSDRLLTETDCPYLAPMPFRGKQNEPGYSVFNAYEISLIKGVNLYEIALQLEENLNNLFTVEKP